LACFSKGYPPKHLPPPTPPLLVGGDRLFKGPPPEKLTRKKGKLPQLAWTHPTQKTEENPNGNPSYPGSSPPKNGCPTTPGGGPRAPPETTPRGVGMFLAKKFGLPPLPPKGWAQSVFFPAPPRGKNWKSSPGPNRGGGGLPWGFCFCGKMAPPRGPPPPGQPVPPALCFLTGWGEKTDP